jgi:8-oxo-dGTP diphosphatase
MMVKLTADILLLARDSEDQRCVLLVQRKYDPFQGKWALPGGHVEAEETALEAAHRELEEETGLIVSVLNGLGVYSGPGRDPRDRYVTEVFGAYLGAWPFGGMPRVRAADDAADARWWRFSDSTGDMMAFDHHTIIGDTWASVMECKQRSAKDIGEMIDRFGRRQLTAEAEVVLSTLWWVFNATNPDSMVTQYLSPDRGVTLRW